MTSTGKKDTGAEAPAAAGMVIRAPTLAIAGLQDGCIDPVIFELTMGGEGEGCVASSRRAPWIHLHT
jgi:hypothetical protein